MYKTEYDTFMKAWYVKGLGYYKTKDDALEAARQARDAKALMKTVSVPLTRDVAVKLEMMAEKKHMRLAALARELITKGVNDYGTKEN